MIAKFKDFFSPANGGFEAARNWYCAQLNNVNEADEKGKKDYVVAACLCLSECL
jgi:hypothetical protein